MEYFEEIRLRDGRTCTLRNGTQEDGQAELDIFILTHEQTDYLRSYPDEGSSTPEEEGAYLQEQTESAREIEILAVVDGAVVGSAGIEAVGSSSKTCHRAEFGVGIDRAFWGLGIGRALMDACIACARKAGYEQLELDVVADNERAVAMYRRAGFVEYGRNPRGFKTREGRYQELVYMRLEL